MIVIDLTFLTRDDQDSINERAAWTDEQQRIFSEFCAGNLTDEGIMQALHMDRKRFYKIKRQIMEKIVRIAAR